MKRKHLAKYGRPGSLVRVFEETRGATKRVVVQWGSKANREQTSYPATKEGRGEALAFAEGFIAEASVSPSLRLKPITTRELWLRYREHAFPTLRPRSKILYADAWRKWEQFFTPDRPAAEFRLTDASRFRSAMEAAGLATATIKHVVDTVRIVYNFAEAAELIDRNRWHQYRFKVAKEKRTQPRAEYSKSEFLAIWRQFDPTKATQWRGYVAIGLLGLYGMRQTATLRLQDPADVDELDGILHFRPEWDKQGEHHRMPILPLTRELLTVARAWRLRDGYRGPWLLYPGREDSGSDTWTLGSLWWALRRAERDAGVPRIDLRAGHGFRRGLVGDLLESGENIELALKAIGDRDVRMARHYAIRRDNRIEKALADRADTFGAVVEGVTKVQPTAENDESDRSEGSGRTDVNPNQPTT